MPLVSLALFDILSGQEFVLVLAIALILFGGDKMPEFARGLAKVIREFKKAAGEVETEFKRVLDEAEHPRPPAKPVITLAPPAQPPAPFEVPEPASGTDPVAGNPAESRGRPPPPPTPEI